MPCTVENCLFGVSGSFAGFCVSSGDLAVRAPVPQVLAGGAVEHDHAPIAIAVGDEHLVGLRIHPDAGRSAEQRRVVAAAGLVVDADRHQVLALARELHHAVVHVGADPDEVVVVDEDAVRVARVDRDVLRRIAPALHDVAGRIELDHRRRRRAARADRRLLHRGRLLLGQRLRQVRHPDVIRASTKTPVTAPRIQLLVMSFGHDGSTTNRGPGRRLLHLRQRSSREEKNGSQKDSAHTTRRVRSMPTFYARLY